MQGPGLEEELVLPGRVGRRGDQWPGLRLDAISSWHLLSTDYVLGPSSRWMATACGAGAVTTCILQRRKLKLRGVD